jgi:hypothetical protein
MEEEQKKKKTSVNRINKKITKKENNKLALKIIIGIGILIALFIFVSLSLNTEKDNKYNEFSFFKEGNLWYCDIIINNNNELYMPFSYHPSEVDEIPIDSLIKEKIMSLDASDFFILAVGEDENSLAVVGASNIARLRKLDYLRSGIVGGIYDESFNLADYLETYNGTESGPPITNCAAASDKRIVMRFVSGNKTSIEFSEETDNCIIATAVEPEDFRRLADKLTFELLGIIDSE